MKYNLIHTCGECKTYVAFYQKGEMEYEFQSDTLCQTLQMVFYQLENGEDEGVFEN